MTDRGHHLCRYDLCVEPKNRVKDRQLILRRSYELGWDCIAWNVRASGKVNSSSIVHLKPVVDVSLDVIQLREAALKRRLVVPAGRYQSESQKAKASEGGVNLKALRQVSRLTVYPGDVMDAQTLTLGNEALRKFDIVAACPVDGKVFSFLCTTAEVDIISLDWAHAPFPFHKKLLDAAVARGITFEVCYAGMYGTSATIRKKIMSGVHELLQYLNGRNVVLSSGADTPSGLRGPMDAANIGAVLGLSKKNAEGACSCSCARVMQRALQRKLGYLPLEIISSDEFHQRWPEKSLRSTKAPTNEMPHASSSSSKRELPDEEDEDDGGKSTKRAKTGDSEIASTRSTGDDFMSF